MCLNSAKIHFLSIFIIQCLAINALQSENALNVNDYDYETDNLPTLVHPPSDSFSLVENNYIKGASSAGSSKYFVPILIDSFGKNFENSIIKPSKKDNGIIQKFRESIDNIKVKSKKSDIIFLIDSSSSVGKVNFYSEIRFVEKLLKHFDLSYNYSRVTLITYSSQGKVVRHVDQISDPSEEHDQCSALRDEIPKLQFVGGGTYTWGALKEAKQIFDVARNNSKKYIFLITDGFSNGKNPISMAQELKENNVTIFTIGIKSGNSAELFNISSSPDENYSFLLQSFLQFEKLVRNALHKDHKMSYKISLKNHDRCNILCDMKNVNYTDSCCNKDATCECGIPSGVYSCSCPPGYIGSGILDDCIPCIANTYWINSDSCRSCPDINHHTNTFPATSLDHCVCKEGFKRTEDNRCEGITCPELLPPENGYFVKQTKTCANVLNAACGARCKSGFQLKGTSLRLCQENGTWSGTEASCDLKSCPSLPVPYYGLIICKNRDVNLTSFDYSPKNDTFMEFYEDETKRVTEIMPIDTECSYKCGLGYYLVGSKTRTCLPLAKWDGLQTSCKQILCSPLPKPIYGDYELSDCTKFKVPFNTNCTLECPEGFDLKGPEIKTCGGKKNGVWSQRNKIPKCIDETSPNIQCPKSFDLIVDPKNDSIFIKSLPPPSNLFDTSGSNVTYWLDPSIDENMGIHLIIGEHNFTYFASDEFNNKAECNFTVNVVDKTPPNVENCIDPTEFLVPSGTVIEWDQPTFYDNSNKEIKLNRSLDPGPLDPGKYQVVYEAIDSSNNSNSCVLNITVKEYSCGILEPPLNGKSLCAKNLTHTWCEISCNIGYTMYHPEIHSNFENFRLNCSNSNPFWELNPLPDCTVIELPNSIEQLLTISLDSDDSICLNENSQDELKKNLGETIKSYLCEEAEECDIVTEIPDCLEDESEPNNDINDRTFYRISKREITDLMENFNQTRKPKKYRSSMKLRLFTRVGKKLGIWKRNNTLSENVRQVKNQLQNVESVDDSVKKVLEEMKIDVKNLKFDELIHCPDGSIPKNHLCVQCPRGTYQDAALDRCQYCPIGSYNDETGRAICRTCPQNYSTRKIGQTSYSDCKEFCPPGKIAKIRKPRRQSRPGFSHPRSLMPFCKKCNSGEYQPFYDQTECLKCPKDFESNRGSTSITDCRQKELHPCLKNSTICGNFGYCFPAENGSYLYSCKCVNGFIGSHCEYQVNLCLSAPCYNNGFCYYANQTAIACKCPSQFRGRLCEEPKYSCGNVFCQNGGTCLETDDDIYCDCPLNYGGKLCEQKISTNYCSQSPCETGSCYSRPDGYQCLCPPGVIGKRCHLRPCDYFPCHENTICVDIMNFPTTKESYECHCPVGLRGYNCTEQENPCDSQPCKNNGRCVSQNLRERHATSGRNFNAGNEEEYGKYICKCQPFFYGKSCETFTSPDYIMEFGKTSTTKNYVKMKGPDSHLKELSFCVWMQTSDTFNYGTLISYATDVDDNAFTFGDYTGFVLYVNGQNTVTDIVTNDGQWHFICVSWASENGFYEIYLDGHLQSTGFNLSSSQVLSKNGVFVIGQDQDFKGGGFSETESYIGKLAYLDIWDGFILGHQVQEFYTSCEPYEGSLYSWSDFKSEIQGDINIHRSNFCKECSKNLTLSNGYIEIMANIAMYYCNPGYMLNGHYVRYCLRTSEWSSQIPYCTIVDCGKLQKLDNGYIEYSGTFYRSESEYHCNDGFILDGNKHRSCLANGSWSGLEAKCLSKVNCNRINTLPNYNIIYADNNRGILDSNWTDFQVGTYAEITCYNDILQTQVYGLFTCLDDGEWDGELPESCDEFSTTVEIPQTSSIIPPTKFVPTTIKPTTKLLHPTNARVTETTPLTLTITTTLSTTIKTTPTKLTTIDDITTIAQYINSLATLSNDALTTENVTSTTISQPLWSSVAEELETTSLPSKLFFSNLKEYFFFGCNANEILPLLCKYQEQSNYFKDLSDFQPPNSKEYHKMDEKLLELLNNHYKFLIKDLIVRYENMFNLLLYGVENPSYLLKLSPVMEDSIRMILCMYIDMILWNDDFEMFNINESSDKEDITNDITVLILKVSLPVYNDYKLRIEKYEENYELTTIRTKRTSGFNTDLLSIPQNKDEIIDVSIHYCRGEDVNKIPENGFITQSENSFDVNFFEETYDIGKKLYLACNNGYEIHGNREISCQPDATWSKILARCSKVSNVIN